MLPQIEASPRPGAVGRWRAQGERVVNAFKPSFDDTPYMRESAAAMMEGPRYFTHWILWATFAFVGLGCIWASLATLDEFTVAEGKIIPSSRVQTVQNLEGGIVAEIMVHPGDVVKKDQVLMRIDDTRFTSSSLEGKAKNDALVARIARLSAEAAGAPFAPPAQLEKENPKLVQQERTLFESRQREFQANQAVLQRQADQRRQELSEKRARQQQLADSHALVKRELDLMRPMGKQGLVSEVDLLRLERQANDIKGESDAARLAIPRLEAAYTEARQKIEEGVAHFRAETMKDLNQTRAEQAALSAANTALDDRVNRTLVRAPMSGVVKQIKVNTVGGVIQPGMDLVEIVPQEDTLLVEAKVRPADVAFLHPGQKAKVKLTAYDSSIYGSFPATLESISADTIVPDKPGEKPESFYQVRVRTEKNVPSGHGKPVAILPGMVATVDIQTGQKTVMQYLLNPIIKTKDMALRER